MSNQSALFVPVEVKALVVNDHTRIGRNFQRWRMNYTNLSYYTSPEPPAFSSNADDFKNNPGNNGVYLHWTLPQALRNGWQNPCTGSMDMWLVPNRWLVLRYSGPLDNRKADAWVVESDFIDPNKGTSPYIDPFAAANRPTSIGRKLDLNNPQWQETGSQDLFLTAVGPGDITFAAYQPYVENVFSIHDSLEGISGTDTLSYLVVGWYSRSDKDILFQAASAPANPECSKQWNPGESFSQWLDELNWTAADREGSTTHTSIYHGLVTGLDWQKSGPIPDSARPTNQENVNAAVGNTAIDALTALIQTQVDAAGESGSINPQLLEAFQYGLLNVMDEPDGEKIVLQKIQQAWFNGSRGGYYWEIVNLPLAAPEDETDRTDLTPTELEKEAHWLAALNQAQLEYDNAVELLNAMQWELYAMWWKRGNADNLLQYPSDLSDQQFADQLNPQNQSGLSYRVYAQIQKVRTLQGNIPWGDTQEQLDAAVEQYARNKSLPGTRQLKRCNKPSYFEANDPVLLISGAKPSGLLTRETPLNCRFPNQLITGFTFNGTDITATAMQGAIPTPALTHLPAQVAGLLNEFFFLDPDNAAMAAKKALNTDSSTTISQVRQVMAAHNAVTGTLPDLDLSAWQQPWAPLYLMWQAAYYPIAHDSDGAENWSFDGENYLWNGKGAASSPMTFSGRTFLTPQSSFNFKAQLDAYRQNNPDADLKAVEDFINQTDDWDFLSQGMEGLSAQMTLRSTLSNLAPDNKTVLFEPDVTLADLTGDNANQAPNPGVSQKVPFEGWPPSEFQQYRSGQFYFLRLMVVDCFGQSIEIVNSSTSAQFKPVLAPGLIPDKTVLPGEPYRFIQLPPRLLQPGRINFNFVSCKNDDQILQLHAGINPVCAWVLPNHLDRGLSFFDNTGSALGEMRVDTGENRQQIVQWSRAPGSGYTSLDAVKRDFHHLGAFLEALQAKGPTAFANLLQVIDETLWTIDPLGARDDANLSVLVGRPLALVRARLQLEMEGPPLTDNSWQYTFDPAQPEAPNYTFPVMLGNVNLMKDGLLGYFSGDDYDVFNTTHYPEEDITPTSPPYIRKIGSNNNYINLEFNDQSKALLTLLVDPRAAVHAYTPVLPTTAIQVPQVYIDSALQRMEVTFRTGPLLSDAQVPEDGSLENATILMPKPNEKNGTWNWLEFDGTQWLSRDIADTDDGVRFSNIQPRLRTGLLNLKNAIKEKK